ncbi:hypothetical protein Cgig2_003183 [Carnegiea gigantea]|uniref:Dihydrolipoyl dehydrogenase n=1 Tax=Carnegiea gigantea TaxID=171969 RepID=A0A9Q1K248_9CARY|nr:hypothetical protein Cgig2_003183 [Carnegiea gigantea]
MKFKLKTKVVGVDTSGDVVKLTLEPAAGGEQTTLEADVEEHYSLPGWGGKKLGWPNIVGVYAIDDVIPGPMLAHKAEEDGVACVEFIAEKHGHVDYDTVPEVMYTSPEVPSVGKTEEQVKALGVDYRVGKFLFMANSRAKAIDNAEGLVKILAEKETDMILGVHIMAPNAGELIHEAVIALQYGASSEDIARTCHAYPTMSEAVKEAVMATYDKTIHISNSILLLGNLCNSIDALRCTLSLSSFSRRFSFASGDNDVVVIGGGPGATSPPLKLLSLASRPHVLRSVALSVGPASTSATQSTPYPWNPQSMVKQPEARALLHSSHMYHEAKHSFASHGVKFSSVEVDLPAMLAQKDKVVANLTRGIEGLFKKNKVNYVKGYGKFVSPSEAKSTIVKGKHVIIATSFDVKSLPGITIDEKRIVSSTGALALSEFPKRLVVIGAGYIGLEMGFEWGRLGSEVTVIEFAPDIVPTMDGEVHKQFQRSLEKQGMKFKLKTKVVGVDTSGDVVKLTLEPVTGGEQTTLEAEADVVLVSAERTPFTAGLGLEKLGVEIDKAGRILVNEQFATNVPGVYAIRDVIPGPMLAHKAEEDGVACVEFVSGKEGHVDYDMVPGVVYTSPEVASLGKTKEQVKALGVSYRVGKFPFMANSRAKAIDNAEGLVRILAEKETDKIMGVHIMAPNAGELIHEAVLALQYRALSEDIARTCHAHPTMSEAVKEAAMATYDKPIHI